jgi:hypothetical protein
MDWFSLGLRMSPAEYFGKDVVIVPGDVSCFGVAEPAPVQMIPAVRSACRVWGSNVVARHVHTFHYMSLVLPTRNSGKGFLISRQTVLHLDRQHPAASAACRNSRYSDKREVKRAYLKKEVGS